MTEQEKKNAVDNLLYLKKQGKLSDDEFASMLSRINIQEEQDEKREKEESEEKFKKEYKKGWGCLVWVIGLLILVIGGYLYATNKPKQSDTSYPSTSTYKSSSSYSSSSSSSYISSDQEATAITLAQELVKKELKSPSTAKFPWSFSEYTVSRSGENWIVKGYVDAQNSFGAMIRSNFEACFKMKKQGIYDRGIKVYTIIK